MMNADMDATAAGGEAAALHEAYALATAFLASLPQRPVSQVPTPAEMAVALDEALPENGRDPAGVVGEWFARAERGITASPGPRFFGFVNGGVTPAALAGDWLASAIDQNAGLWAGSPAAAQTELVVLRWLQELFGLPAEWAGALTSGATMANLVGLVTARQWAGRQLGFDAAGDGLAGQPSIAVVASSEIHLSAVKCLGTLGFGRNQVRRVAARCGAADVDALAGLLRGIDGPVILIGNAGEVNSGHFDDLAALADLRDGHPGGAWLHVDGAFGLFAAVSPRLAHLVRGIERADSVAADGHKWLNVPYDCGFAFVRDGSLLREAFAVGGAYVAGGAGWDPFTHVPEMSRRFRGLAAWCALKAYGRAGYRALVERCVDNAAAFARWVDETPGVELMNPAPLNIVCFRLVRAGLDELASDELNRLAVRAIQSDGRAFVTGTVWQGRAAIRAAFDNWRTTPADVRLLQEAVAQVGASLSA
ncbi:MAG: L-2,4-diaminobutyrate decarboxylase [Accumulibacter sp.]|uniref:pyridoxal phosphate-dependent decarboxylase family protein n=1 Tax=Accumulibacter sp. TaxID=2053492 RepID=UPI0011F981E4|nr:pyridoxal-dependent decarboxylase [Accumulibacter sp.]TLD43902.1 MAG: L-2,4-diaminobutyrate decarboxylase [Accumulibacter sp.]